VVKINKNLIGAVLVCLIAGVSTGYTIGYVIYNRPAKGALQLWATLYIDTSAGNYTARYIVYYYNGTSIPLTTVNGPSYTGLNITRPIHASVGLLGGWTIEAWATLTPYNGLSVPPDSTVAISIGWAGSNGGFDGSKTYGKYPTEAHVIVNLS
jgi:hypothetical protein